MLRGILRLREEACGFEEDGHGGGVVIRSWRAGRRVVVGTENPVGFLASAKILGHRFETVASDAIDTECLAENREPGARKNLLDEIRRPREARGIVVKIALFERERFGDLEEASLEFAGAFGREFLHGKNCSWQERLLAAWNHDHLRRLLVLLCG